MVCRTGQKSFGIEVFSYRNQILFKAHYEEVRKGTPVVLLVVRQTPGGKVEGVKLDEAEANWVEDYLIRRALDKNPHLRNKKQTVHFTNVRIPGIHNANAKTKADRDLATAIGVKKPFGFTKPVGKFHQRKSKSA